MFMQVTRLSPAGWAHVIFFGLLIPALVLRNRRLMAAGALPLPPRLTHFKGTSAQLLVFGLASLLTASAQRIDLFPTSSAHALRGAGAGIGMYAVAVVLMRPRWRRAVEQRTRVVHLFTAENAAERAWWLAVSVIAGVTEEITWRGVQTALLVPLVGSYPLAALASALSFGAAHMVQGWRSAAIIVTFALGLQAMVGASGSLYFAMATHVAYDITAGLTYGRLARELGYTPNLG